LRLFQHDRGKIYTRKCSTNLLNVGDSIVHRDFIVIQAVVLLIATVVLVLNLLIDLLYGVLDPRIRYQ